MVWAGCPVSRNHSRTLVKNNRPKVAESGCRPTSKGIRSIRSRWQTVTSTPATHPRQRWWKPITRLSNLHSRTHFFGRCGDGKGRVIFLAQGRKVADKFKTVVVPGSASGYHGRARVFEARVLGQPIRDEGRKAAVCEKRGGGSQEQEQAQREEKQGQQNVVKSERAGVLGQRIWEKGREATTCKKLEGKNKSKDWNND